MLDSGAMSPSRDTRPWHSTLLIVVLVLMIVALAAFAIFVWADFLYSCGPGTTVALPPTSVPASAAASTTASTTTEPTTTSTAPVPVLPLDFDGTSAMGHIQALAEGIGPRKSGTPAENDALDHATAYLQSLDYDVRAQEVSLPGGQSSQNLSAVKEGTSDSVIVIGAHIDTKAGAPGGNDNASGVAVVLELARDFRSADTVATLEFVVFGAEEMTDADADHHHYGSRQFLQGLTDEQRAALVGMVSVDMVGYGSEFTVRTMNKGPQLLRQMVKDYSNGHDLPARYLKDTGTYGWSDHEPFELAGYPAVWLEWREDPAYHTARDTYSHCDPEDVQRVGSMLLGFLGGLTQADLDALASAREL